MAKRTLNVEVPASDVLHMHIIKSQAARDVLAERERQIKVEGWTPEHDDEHGDGAMAYAAAAYAVASVEKPGTLMKASALFMWTGWAKSWWKPKDRRSDLIRAGALILAEIERLDRAAGKAGVPGTPISPPLTPGQELAHAMAKPYVKPNTVTVGVPVPPHQTPTPEHTHGKKD